VQRSGEKAVLCEILSIFHSSDRADKISHANDASLLVGSIPPGGLGSVALSCLMVCRCVEVASCMELTRFVCHQGRKVKVVCGFWLR
jgi:hypothetical protein